MAKPARPPWYIPDTVAPAYAFFLSHVTEDARAVIQLKTQITQLTRRRGRAALACFLDKHDWLIANDLVGVIREALLRSEYVVLWVTPAYLEASKRGWVWVEFACGAAGVEPQLSPPWRALPLHCAGVPRRPAGRRRPDALVRLLEADPRRSESPMGSPGDRATAGRVLQPRGQPAWSSEGRPHGRSQEDISACKSASS